MIKAPLALFPFFIIITFPLLAEIWKYLIQFVMVTKKYIKNIKIILITKVQEHPFWEIYSLFYFFWFYKKKAKFITISDSMSLELKTFKIPNERIFKIVNGIDSSRFKKIIKSTTIKKNKNTFYILSVGRNDSRKGFIFLIEAAEKLIKKKF